MTIAVQKSIPGNNQGKQGEMRLVVHSSGMYLYVKGYSTLGSLRLSMQGTSQQDARDARRILQENVRTLIQHDGTSTGIAADAVHGDGTIAGNSGKRRSASHPDAPL